MIDTKPFLVQFIEVVVVVVVVVFVVVVLLVVVVAFLRGFVSKVVMRSVTE